MQRPTSVTVFGILNICWGSISLLSFGLSLVVLAFFQHAASVPTTELLNQNEVYRLWRNIGTVLGIIGSCALLAGGIGLLKLKPWGRGLSIGYAIYAIIFALVSLVVNVTIVFPTLTKFAQSTGDKTLAFASNVGAYSALIGVGVGVIYPGLLLFFMFRRNVVQAFRLAPQPPALPLV